MRCSSWGTAVDGPPQAVDKMKIGRPPRPDHRGISALFQSSREEVPNGTLAQRLNAPARPVATRKVAAARDPPELNAATAPADNPTGCTSTICSKLQSSTVPRTSISRSAPSR